jgi:hypothetical protein
MKITRLFSDDAGDSRFEEIDIPLTDAGDIGRLSERVAAQSVVFRETGGDYDYDFHNAPDRQFIIMLDGVIEIETSLGERRRFAGGDVLLVEDTQGKGHKTWSVDHKLRRSIFIKLGNEPLPS